MVKHLSHADLILRAARGVESMIRDKAREHDLTSRHIDILLLLAAEPGLSQSEMQERYFSDRSTLSSIVRTLIERGYVVGRIDKEDNRRHVNTLTAKGSAMAKIAERIKAEVDRDVEMRLGSATGFAAKLSTLWSGLKHRERDAA